MCVHACAAGIDVRLDATLAERNLAANSFDLALRKANVGSMSGAVKLFDETMQPVCSPFAARLQPAPGQRVVAGAAHPRRPGSPHCFTRYAEAIAAAVAGQGVAPGRRPLVDGLLTSG